MRRTLRFHKDLWKEGSGSVPLEELSTSETRLVDMLVGSLGDDYSWARECPAGARARIDLCVYDGWTLYGIEAKLSNWRRALGQAYLNRYAVDYPFMALPAVIIKPSIIEEAGLFGVGIIAVEEEVVRVVLGASAGVPSDQTRKRLIDLCLTDARSASHDD